MSMLSLRCIKAAICCLAVGIGLGVCFAFDRGLGARLRPLHAELNLWGWVTLLIYGMAYHMLPRFLGAPIRHVRLAHAQSWLAIIGVVSTALGRLALLEQLPGSTILMGAGGLLQMLAAGCFSFLIATLLLHTGGTHSNAAAHHRGR